MYVNHQILYSTFLLLTFWPLNPNIFPEPTTSLFSLMLLAPHWLPFFCPFNVLNSKSQSPELNDSVLRCCSLLSAGMLLILCFARHPKERSTWISQTPLCVWDSSVCQWSIHLLMLGFQFSAGWREIFLWLCWVPQEAIWTWLQGNITSICSWVCK